MTTQAVTVASERQLQPIVKKNGFIYKLVKRSKKVAIYSQHFKEKGGVAGDRISFEIFQIRIGGGPANFDGVKSFIEPKEVFPGNEAFGKTAYCLPTLERAEACFIELEARVLDESEPIEAETEDEETIED
jgi:hypothetical protein